MLSTFAGYVARIYSGYFGYLIYVTMMAIPAGKLAMIDCYAAYDIWLSLLAGWSCWLNLC